MNSFLKILLVLALWLLYCFLLLKGCSKQLCAGCLSGESSAVVAPPEGDSAALISRRYPLDFRWSQATPNTNEGFDSLRQAILSGMTADNTLEITGLYFEEEEKPADFPNLGFARAEAVKKLLAGRIPPERIITKARVVDEPPGAREGYFEAALFEWQEKEEEIAETVEELDDRVNVRFSYNSTEREYNPQVDEYLRKLAENLKQTGRIVTLTGHTDNSGADEYNVDLGQRRANQIRQILLNYGVPAAQIKTSSKGESQPTASNETEEGRHENRRVEIRFPN